MYTNSLYSLGESAKRAGAKRIHKSLTVAYAEDKYIELLPKIVSLPSPSVTKLRVNKIELNLDSTSKPSIARDDVYDIFLNQGRNDVAYVMLVDHTLDLRAVEQETLDELVVYFDIIELIRRLQDPTMQPNDVFVFQNTVLVSPSIRRLYPGVGVVMRNFATVQRFQEPFDMLCAIYCTYSALVSRGFNKVLFIHEDLYRSDQIRMECIQVLAAWFAGIGSVNITIDFPVQPIIDALSGSTTPREFIGKMNEVLEFDVKDLEDRLPFGSNL